MSDRQLPWSQAAEMALLGSCLIAQGRCMPALDDLQVDEFFLPAHRFVWESMRAVYKRRGALDPVMLADELKARKELPRLEGGEAYLMALAGSTPTAENVLHYAAEVREKSRVRRVISLAADLQQRAYSGTVKADELAADLREGTAALEQAGDGGPVRIGDKLQESLDAIEAKGKNTAAFTIPTGLTEFDRKIGGLRAGKLIVMGGLPSMGKTSAAAGICAHAALLGIPTLVISLETDFQDMVERFIGWQSGVAPHEMNTSKLTSAHWGRMYDAAAKLLPAPLWVDDRPWHTTSRLLGTIRRWHARHVGSSSGPAKKKALVMLDYVQLVKGEVKSDKRRDQEIGDVTGGLKNLAKELALPVLAISSLNSEGFKEKGPPVLGQFRDSKQIEYDADVVIFPYREFQKNKNGQVDKNIPGPAEWIVAKYKGGPTGSIGCWWESSLMRFQDVGDEERQEQLPAVAG